MTESCLSWFEPWHWKKTKRYHTKIDRDVMQGGKAIFLHVANPSSIPGTTCDLPHAPPGVIPDH